MRLRNKKMIVFWVLAMVLGFACQSGGSEIEGTVWNDRNGNGVRDAALFVGESPDVVFVIDVSGSTGSSFGGTAVGDINWDGKSDTILDAELAGFIALNQELINLGFGQSAKVGIIVFGDCGVQADMNPVMPEKQLVTSPESDADGNGMLDIIEILSSIQEGAFGAGIGTDYEDALRNAVGIFTSEGTVPGDGNLLFLSDGFGVGEFNDELAELMSLQVNLRAFGVGSGADLSQLQIIDDAAKVFTSIDELMNMLSGFGDDIDTATGSVEKLIYTDAGIANVTVFLDMNDNGVRDANEPYQVTQNDNPATPYINETGYYRFTGLGAGSYIVRQELPAGYIQTSPEAGKYNITLTENMKSEGNDFGNASATVSFSSPTFSVNEDGTPIMAVTVIRSGLTDREVSVTIMLADETATGTVDYDSKPIYVQFTSGETRKSITIPVFDDKEGEGNETVRLTLTNPTGGAVLGTQNIATLSIEDDEITLSFSTSEFSVNEDGTPLIPITINRTGRYESVNAIVKLSDGTAVSPEDYDNKSVTVWFPSSVATATITVPIVDDDLHENTETVRLTLETSDSGVVIGKQGTAILKIMDNETDIGGNTPDKAYSVILTDSLAEFADFVGKIDKTDYYVFELSEDNASFYIFSMFLKSFEANVSGELLDASGNILKKIVTNAAQESSFTILLRAGIY